MIIHFVIPILLKTNIFIKFMIICVHQTAGPFHITFSMRNGKSRKILNSANSQKYSTVPMLNSAKLWQSMGQWPCTCRMVLAEPYQMIHAEIKPYWILAAWQYLLFLRFVFWGKIGESSAMPVECAWRVGLWKDIWFHFLGNHTLFGCNIIHLRYSRLC